MPKEKITKNKICISLDKEVDKEIHRIEKTMNLKHSYIINRILRSFLFNEHFETANKITKE